jgi:antitoxin CptB
VHKDRSEYRKLCWRSRRGMLELDRLLVPFTEHAFLTLSAEDQLRYQHLLSFEDTDLLDWLVNNIPSPDAEVNAIVPVILKYVRTHSL